MLKQGSIPNAVHSPNACLPVPPSQARPPNPLAWQSGNQIRRGFRNAGKDVRILPGIGNDSPSYDALSQAEMEFSSKMNAPERIVYLEKSMAFIKAQHQELVNSLHEEVDRLKRKNKELQFCMMMMSRGKQSSSGKGEGSTAKGSATSSRRPHSKHVRRSADQSTDTTHLCDCTNASAGDTVQSKATFLSTSEGQQKRPTDKLEELKQLFLEGEVSELKESLEKERKENQRLLTIIKSKLQTRESLSASVDNLHSMMPNLQTDGMLDLEYDLPVLSKNDLPFGATLNPLLVHLPSSPPRPPSIRECQTIIQHLYSINNRQSHELNQLKSDLRDVLYSHKWTPDAYLMARAYVAEEDAAAAAISNESNADGRNHLPRIPLKLTTRKLPESVYAAQELISLPPLKTMVGNQSMERQKRTQMLQKSKSAKYTPN